LALPPCTVISSFGSSKFHSLVKSCMMSSGLVSYASRTYCNTGQYLVRHWMTSTGSFLSPCPDQLWTPHPHSFLSNGVVYLEVKQLKHEDDNLLTSSDEIQHAWNLIPTLLISLHGIELRHRDNLYFTIAALLITIINIPCIMV
jgi:hypothetical protein